MAIMPIVAIMPIMPIMVIMIIMAIMIIVVIMATMVMYTLVYTDTEQLIDWEKRSIRVLTTVLGVYFPMDRGELH